MPFTYTHPRPAIAVDSVVFQHKDQSLSILLIQRKNQPFADQWALPGGFMDIEETSAAAAIRELREETGLNIGKLDVLGVYDAIDRDPRTRVVSIAYFGIYEPKIKPALRASDDAKALKWFHIDKLPALAFDHEIIIGNAIQRINP